MNNKSSIDNNLDRKTPTMYQHSDTKEYADKLDKEDSLKDFRSKFNLPSERNIYFCGNSLGAQPKGVYEAVEGQLDRWRTLGVDAHFEGEGAWLNIHKKIAQQFSPIVGAEPDEIAVMNALTVNLHLMMVSFYKPDKKRFKIITEANAFPSDLYALDSQIKWHGLNPEEALIEIEPRSGEYCLRTEDIIQKIHDNKDSLALVLLGGVNYYTGEVMDMQQITQEAQKAGAYVGFDLAHAAGNIPLSLHDWNVDFAVWCSYKYLNAGPGTPSGVFVNKKYAEDHTLNRLTGWWGYDKNERFLMKRDFKPEYGAEGWQISNYPIFAMASLHTALEIFNEAGINNLRTKSELLTDYLEYLINQINTRLQDDEKIKIITPADTAHRGCQLSLVIPKGKEVFNKISKEKIICDWREPDVLRLAPVPLYNTFSEVFTFHEKLLSAIIECRI